MCAHLVSMCPVVSRWVRLVKLAPWNFQPTEKVCVYLCAFLCVPDCRMKEHLVCSDSSRSGDVRSVIEDRRRVLQSNHAFRWRGRVLCLFPGIEKKKKRTFWTPEQQIEQTWQLQPNKTRPLHQPFAALLNSAASVMAEWWIGEMCAIAVWLNSWLKRFITIIKYEGGDYFYMMV